MKFDRNRITIRLLILPHKSSCIFNDLIRDGIIKFGLNRGSDAENLLKLPDAEKNSFFGNLNFPPGLSTD